VTAAGDLRSAAAGIILGHMADITAVLRAIDRGDPHAAAELLPLVYAELRKLAAARLAHEAPGQTLQPTALVHEAYLRLVASGGSHAPGEVQDRGVDTDPLRGYPGLPQFAGRGHFFAAAAEAMCRILIDAARRKKTEKHGGGRRRVPLDESHRITESPDHLLALDDVLTRFAAEEPAKAELVKLRFFAGLTVPEAAATLGVSVATAERWWVYARTWLYAALSDDEGP
jgi:ECF sigma factor